MCAEGPLGAIIHTLVGKYNIKLAEVLRGNSDMAWLQYM